MNSKQKGSYGVGTAIAYFTELGYVVSVPLNDSQDYDLVVDDGGLKKVQVKYTSQKAESGRYKVSLRSISGTSRKTYSTVADSGVDILFVVTELKEIYVIPKSEVTCKSNLTLDDGMRERYLVK